jgi:hypothetical protein
LQAFGWLHLQLGVLPSLLTKYEAPMNSGISQQQLESFGRGPAILSVALQQFPKRMWLYKPSAGIWSIHEILLHLADREVHSYIRCRRFIAEPGSSVPKFDSKGWACSLGYFHQSTWEALKIVRHLRKMTYGLLLALPESVWEHSLEHETEGRLTLSEWIRLETEHIPRHIRQMRRNYEKWLEGHFGGKEARHRRHSGSISVLYGRSCLRPSHQFES